MAKYQIWNRKDNIITPIFENLTPEEWISRYPVAGIESIVPIIAAGEINGAFFGTLGQLVEIYSNQGCDFSSCITNEEKLEAIELFEQNKEAALIAAQNTISTDERIAAALEAQVLMSMPDEDEI